MPATVKELYISDHPLEGGPEYKVTAVQVAPAIHLSKWQTEFEERAKSQGKILEPV